ncbi:MAG TPA: class I SAM-dependent methyltransferase [Candidatus Omnitrophota bacterium]|nr:class I SAM-dependent methyltransferase [Candidatus Omnitrophota bacterium]HSA30831.1 class I SAM-dependent methyltransferase [Candidatus Omnitrophota bacterium]
MDAAYWNGKAGVYEEEIFNVWEGDRDGTLKSFFERGEFRSQTVLDCGCGIGHGIATLAKHFKSVHAVDISKECLTVAQERHGSLANVKFFAADLAKRSSALPAADCAVSINSVITPSLKTRMKMLKNIREHLKPGGLLVLVVPSLESYYYASYKLIEWKLREGAGGVLRFGHEPLFKGHGVLPIDGVLTKHYLREELISFLRLVGFEVEEVQKIRYDWDTEYENPPRWMREPYPWDWMCVARRQSSKRKEKEIKTNRP